MVISLGGNWNSGWAYDIHTVESVHIGLDEYGRDRFETTRSEMGELVYQLKYKRDKKAAAKIVVLLDSIKGIEKFDFIIPIPATVKGRPYQPVEMIAVALGDRRGVKVLKDALTNDGNEELKEIAEPVARDEMLQKALTLSGNDNVAGKKVLLVDDLYRSGSTLRVATNLLYHEGKVKAISVLTMTKTRSKR